jgi:hypothetical protein
MPAFIQSHEETENEWKEYLSRPQFISVQYLQFRNHGLGSTPVESYQNLMMPTLHPSHHSYSDIETTKMRAKNWKQIPKPAIEHVGATSQFTYPLPHWDRFLPDKRVFLRMPEFRNPFRSFKF